MSYAVDIATILTPATVAARILARTHKFPFVMGVNLFVGILPDTPDECIALIDQSGGSQDPILEIDTSKVQILVRSHSHQRGFAICRIVESVLKSITPQSIDSHNVIGAWLTTNAFFIERDDNKNSLFSINIKITIEQIDGLKVSLIPEDLLEVSEVYDGDIDQFLVDSQDLENELLHFGSSGSHNWQ